MTTPAEIAREALRQLAARHVPPTPKNYCALYGQIAATDGGGSCRAGGADDSLACPERATALQELLSQVLDGAHCLVQRHAALAGEVAAAARSARFSPPDELTRGLLKRLHELVPRMRDAAADDAALHDGLVRLLQLMLRTTREMAVDNTALDDLTATVERLLGRLDVSSIAQAERSVRDLLARHGQFRSGLEEVKNNLREMASRFIDRLAAWSATTGDYHDKIAGYAQQIANAQDVKELNAVLQEVMRETRSMQDGAESSRRELIQARREAERAHERIRGLEADLARATRKMREDGLTGMLNRYGVEGDFEREAARSDRDGQPLCVALLDIDDFKRLNDAFGHQGGDQALLYLARMMKRTARRGDIVARYGGEEFLILLPNTTLEAARAFVVRLQRALTRHLFLHRNEHLLITFSGGVAQRTPGEAREAILERVDQALYRAKRAGKNRVFAAH